MNFFIVLLSSVTHYFLSLGPNILCCKTSKNEDYNFNSMLIHSEQSLRNYLWYPEYSKDGSTHNHNTNKRTRYTSTYMVIWIMFYYWYYIGKTNSYQTTKRFEYVWLKSRVTSASPFELTNLSTTAWLSTALAPTLGEFPISDRVIYSFYREIQTTMT
jgi:hypothetical protein